jgi:uncharacterized protein DUF4209
MSIAKHIPDANEIAAALLESSEKEDHGFADVFRKRHQVEPERGWNLLQSVFGFLFQPSNASAPFQPMSVWDGRRSMIPSDLSGQHLSMLAGAADSVDDPEFRARILDVLWLQRRDVNAARAAVDAYLQSGSRVEHPENWVASMRRYERAVRLAYQIEAKGNLPKSVLGHLEARVVHYDGSDPLYFTLKALELLAEFSFGDLRQLAEIAGRVGSAARAAGDLERARKHFGVQARLLKNAKDAEGVEAARVAEAECLAEAAEQHERAGSSIAAHHFWQQAINAFRERPTLRARVPELQRRLATAGESALQEMTRHTVEIDLGEPITASRKAISTLPLEDAFLTFATLVPLIDPAALREEAIEYIRDHPLQSLHEASLFDAAGRKVGTRPAASEQNPEQHEIAIAGFMEQLARFHRTPCLAGYIAPALGQLVKEHDIDEASLERLIGDSPLIQDDRKSLFIQGLLAGFRWDFPTALHLLIPQIENGLRKMLNDLGVLARNIGPDGVEEVWSYERILSHEVTVKTLGPALVYELQSLLVTRLGANFRNLISHGLLSTEALRSETAFYLWWLLLRLIALPTAKMTAFIERRTQ